jgi:hypothetical protein
MSARDSPKGRRGDRPFHASQGQETGPGHPCDRDPSSQVAVSIQVNHSCGEVPHVGGVWTTGPHARGAFARAKACTVAPSGNASIPGSPNAATATTTTVRFRKTSSVSSAATGSAAYRRRLHSCAVPRLRPRVADRVLLQGTFRMPVVRCPAHGGDGDAEREPASTAAAPTPFHATIRFKIRRPRHRRNRLLILQVPTCNAEP